MQSFVTLLHAVAVTEQRRAEAASIRIKYPERVPVSYFH